MRWSRRWLGLHFLWAGAVGKSREGIGSIDGTAFWRREA
jgi:hypothetical protein